MAVINLNKRCKYCGKELNSENSAKNGTRNGAIRYRDECKSCRSFHVTKNNKGNERKKEYMKTYHERTKNVQMHPCLTCNKECIKKYDLSFCSHMCRFMHYVEKTESCWIWKGSKDPSGYGKTNIDSKIMSAHRAVYILVKGNIEEDKFVCHSCDNPSCVNPDHLWMGTHKENMKDMHEKGRIYTKLSPYQINKIRDLWERKEMNSSELCKKFNITSGHLSNIVNRRIWKHI